MERKLLLKIIEANREEHMRAILLWLNSSAKFTDCRFNIIKRGLGVKLT